MKVRKIFSIFSIFLVASASCGCHTKSHIVEPSELVGVTKPSEQNVTMERYILQPADELMVLSSHVPELHEQTQTIRPDGMISFENIGDVSVAGKTPRQAAELIGKEVSKLYTLIGDNPVNVRVTINRSKYYYVIGHVAVPGAKIFTGRETTLSAIAKAVPNLRAWEANIQLIRPNEGKEPRAKICKINFDDMVKDGDMTHNFLLEEGDVIYVPPTILAAIGLTVAEIVSPIFSSVGAASVVAP